MDDRFRDRLGREAADLDKKGIMDEKGVDVPVRVREVEGDAPGAQTEVMEANEVFRTMRDARGWNARLYALSGPQNRADGEGERFRGRHLRIAVEGVTPQQERLIAAIIRSFLIAEVRGAGLTKEKPYRSNREGDDQIAIPNNLMIRVHVDETEYAFEIADDDTPGDSNLDMLYLITYMSDIVNDGELNDLIAHLKAPLPTAESEEAES